MKILAIDFGLKRIGIAIGDTTLNTSIPINPILCQGKEKDIVKIKNLIRQYDINKIVIGYPLNMDGTKSQFTIQTENFNKNLTKKIAIATELVDERLSSFEAEEILKTLYKDYKKRKKFLDSMSALIILRDYMEELNPR